MSHRRSVVVAAVAVLLACGTTAVVTAWRSPQPLPPLVETTFSGEPLALPHHVTVGGSCPPLFFDSPVPPVGSGGDMTMLALSGLPGATSFVVSCLPASQFDGLDGLDGFIDHMRRHPEDSFYVAEPVVEHGPLGDAIRTEQHLSGMTVTEWRVERDGQIVTAGYVRRTGDDSSDADVTAMLASWAWG